VADPDICVHFEPITPGSEKLYVLEGGRFERADPFTTMMVASPTGEPGEVLLHGAHGRLSPAINIEIGLALIARGYTRLVFEAHIDATVTRWATKVSEDGQLARYQVDLTEAAQHVLD
jgi:hypothetical protein